ncbi:MAG: hypothetical protein MJ169_01665 [Treponema sp.]|nr:hypothetical protein [Treponema sp.]
MNTLKTKILFPVILTGLMAAGGCSLAADGPLSVSQKAFFELEIPLWPQGMPAITSWEICIYQGKDPQILSIDNTTRTVEISLRPDIPAAILAQPVLDLNQNGELRISGTAVNLGFPVQPDFFYPAGAVYSPDNSSQKTICLEWCKTSTALCLIQLYQNETDLNTIKYLNWSKLIQTIKEKETAAFSEFKTGARSRSCSCFLDTQSLITKILDAKTITVSYIKTTTASPSRWDFLDENQIKNILYKYIPLNEHAGNFEEIIINYPPTKTATEFYLDGRVIKVMNNKLIQ